MDTVKKIGLLVVLEIIIVLTSFAVLIWNETQHADVMLKVILLIVDVLVLLAIVSIILILIKNERIGKKELEYEVKQIKNAIDASSIVAIANKQGKITYANQQFCKISKYAEKELIGKKHLVKSGFHSKKFSEELWKAISSGNIWRGEIKNKAKDGSFFWVNTTIVPLKSNGKDITEYVSISNDITKRKSLQEELVKNERFSAIGQLASRLAHDLRNPLAIIVNGIELIKETSKEDFTLENCGRIDKALDRMKHQITEVLDFVRIKPYIFEKIRLTELISKATQDLNIPSTIELSLPPNNPEITCDVVQFTTVLTNILHNAIQKFSTEGSITIKYSDDDTTHIIKIEDSGKPIPTEYLEKIFDPLFTTKERGTGLGLAGCKKVIEGHNGRIYAKNNPTTLVIMIPKDISDESPNS